jgi:hypothetical protein
MAEVELAQVDEHPFGISWLIKEAGARASHALQIDGRVWIVDPVEHPAAMERIETLGPVAGVLQLIDRHNRDCAAIAGRLRVPHLRVPAEVPGTPLEVVTVLDSRRWREVALWWPGPEVLVVPETLGTVDAFTAGHGAVGMHPVLRPVPPKALRGMRPEHLLVGHGPPVSGPDARDGVEWAYAHARSDIPRLFATIGRIVVEQVRKR